MKPSVKTALFIFCIIAVGLLSYRFGAHRSAPVAPPEEKAPASTTESVLLPKPVATSADRELLEKALALRDADKPGEARDALRSLVAKLQTAVTPSDDQKAIVQDAEKALGEINIKLLFSLAAAPEKVDYAIKSRDSLGRIAKQFGTTVEVLRKANALRDSVIQPGNRLRVTPTKFAVSVSKSANTMVVTDDGKFFKLYRVGTGQYSTTPTGAFKITDRISNPPWWKDGRTIPYGDKQNILGTHWLALDIPHYGIHGTWDTESIGHQSSAGCIRLLNDDVEELFTMLPIGTPVEIKD